MLAAEHISPTQVSSDHRQPHAAMRRIGGDPDPAALGKRAVGGGEAGGGPHDAVLEPGPVEVAGATQRRQHVLGELAPLRPAPPRSSRGSRRRSARFRRAGRRPAHARAGSASHRPGRDRSSGISSRVRRSAIAAARPDRYQGRRGRMLGPAARPDKQDTGRHPMARHNTVTLSDSDRGLRAAAGLLRAGELVAFPTETVYGLGGDARNDRAVAGIFAAKGRPAFNPLIVHVAALADAERLAIFTTEARALAARFWPGPLTLVLPRRPDSGLSALATAGLPTVALRVPAHPLAHRLLAAFGGPVAAPSANPSGRVSATTRGACPRRARRPHRGNPRRRRLPGRTGIDDRRFRRRSGGAAPARRAVGRDPRRGAGPALGAATRRHRYRARTARVALRPRGGAAAGGGRGRVRRGLARLRSVGARSSRPEPVALRRSRRSRGEPLRAPARDRRARRDGSARAVSPWPRSRAAGWDWRINDRLARAAAPRS